MKIDQDWLTDITRIPSPNCDERPDPTDISLLVIHCISLPPGEFC
ncbi:MAG: AmpD protein, partial [Methylococcaceae bacterium NSP1-1]